VPRLIDRQFEGSLTEQRVLPLESLGSILAWSERWELRTTAYRLVLHEHDQNLARNAARVGRRQ
jgi:hypothetical protein